MTRTITAFYYIGKNESYKCSWTVMSEGITAPRIPIQNIFQQFKLFLIIKILEWLKFERLFENTVIVSSVPNLSNKIPPWIHLILNQFDRQFHLNFTPDDEPPHKSRLRASDEIWELESGSSSWIFKGSMLTRRNSHRSWVTYDYDDIDPTFKSKLATSSESLSKLYRRASAEIDKIGAVFR